MIDASQVSACLVTRGDQPDMVELILASLLEYDEIIIWDNSRLIDYATAGRFMAMALARNQICYTQDDDVVVPRDTQRALLEAYEPAMTTAVYAHFPEEGGYGDMPLVCGGGLIHRSQAFTAIERYRDAHSWGLEENAYADFVVGVLTPFKQIDEPFAINMDVAQHPSRLCNQPWAADAKARVTENARALRDAA